MIDKLNHRLAQVALFLVALTILRITVGCAIGW